MRSIAYVFLFVHFPVWLTWPAIGSGISLAARFVWKDWERIMSTFKGSVSFWDYPILRFMESQQRELDIKRGHNLVLSPIPIYVIGRACKRNPRSVTRSLLRLEKIGRVYEARRRKWLPGQRGSAPPDASVSRWASRY